MWRTLDWSIGTHVQTPVDCALSMMQTGSDPRPPHSEHGNDVKDCLTVSMLLEILQMEDRDWQSLLLIHSDGFLLLIPQVHRFR